MAKNKGKRRERTADEPDERSSALGRNASLAGHAQHGHRGRHGHVHPARPGVPGGGGVGARGVGAAYQQEVGRICDKLHDMNERRAQADATIKHKLRHAKTTIAQRNALLDGVQQTAARSGDALASFTGLETPRALVATRSASEAAWNRNLARLRNCALRLDHASPPPQLVKAIDHLPNLRPVLAADGVKVRSGLGRLGGANCDLQPPRVTGTFTLPPPRVHRQAQERGGAPVANGPRPTGSSAPEQTNNLGTPSTDAPAFAGANASTPEVRHARTEHARGQHAEPPADGPAAPSDGEGGGSASGVNTPSGDVTGGGSAGGGGG